MAFIGVTWNEHKMWSEKPRPFGGGYVDDRGIEQASADRVRFEKEQVRLHELLMVDPSLSDASAFVDNLVAWTRQRIAVLEEQQRKAEQQSVLDAQKADILVRHGLRPAEPQPQTTDAIREARHNAEYQAFLAAQPKLTKQQLDSIDPFGPNAKALLKAEEDLRDPRVQAQRGNPVPDAVAWEAGLVDRHTPAPAPAQPQRRSRIAELRKRVSR